MSKMLFTMLRLVDLEAIGKGLLEAFMWIRAQMSLVQTKTMNMMLTANPITVITKLIPEEIIVQKDSNFGLNWSIDAHTPLNWTLENCTKSTLHWLQKWEKMRIWSGVEKVVRKIHAFCFGWWRVKQRVKGWKETLEGIVMVRGGRSGWETKISSVLYHIMMMMMINLSEIWIKSLWRSILLFFGKKNEGSNY